MATRREPRTARGHAPPPPLLSGTCESAFSCSDGRGAGLARAGSQAQDSGAWTLASWRQAGSACGL